MDKWSPEREKEEKLSKDDAKFIFEQAEKQLKDTIDTSQLITARTTTLATTTVSIMSALVGYLFTKHHEIPQVSLSVLCVGAVYLFLLCCFMTAILRPTIYSTIGSTPKSLFADHFFTPEFDGECRLVEFYKTEMVNYQYRITENQKTNKQRWKDFSLSLSALVACPVFLLSLYFLLCAIR